MFPCEKAFQTEKKSVCFSKNKFSCTPLKKPLYSKSVRKYNTFIKYYFYAEKPHKIIYCMKQLHSCGFPTGLVDANAHVNKKYKKEERSESEVEVEIVLKNEDK